MARWVHGSMVALAAACSPDVNVSALTPLNDLPSPEIAVSPAWMQFGELNRPEELTQTFTLTNVGDDGLDVDRIRWVNDDVGFRLDLPDGTVPATLDHGEAITFDVTFAPETSGLLEAEVQVQSDATNGADLRVRVGGIGIAPDLRVSPEAIAFPLTWERCSPVGVVDLVNHGKQTVTITDVRLQSSDPRLADGGSVPDLPDGLALGAPIDLPYDLGHEDDDAFSVVFEPPHGQTPWEAFVVIESTDSGSPHVIPVSGQARDRLRYAESIEVPERYPVDVVMAVVPTQGPLLGFADSSGERRLVDLPGEVADGYERMKNRLAAARIDWRIGVYTGSIPACFDDVVAWGDADAESALHTAVHQVPAVGPAGDTHQRTLINGVTETLDADAHGWCNESLRRAGAPLRILFVSERPDQSPGFDVSPSSYWYPDVLAWEVHAGGADRLGVDTAYTGWFHCDITKPRATGGFGEMSMHMGGLRMEICSFGFLNRWMAEFDHFLDDIVTFPLSSTDVNPATLEVHLDGTLLTYGYAYDASRSALVFEELPPAGTLTVTHEGAVNCAAP